MKKILVLIALLPLVAFAQDKKSNKGEQIDCSKENFYKSVKEEAQKRLAKLNRDKVIQFSNELLVKAEKLDLRELELEKREKQLKILESSFSKKVAEFDQKQNKIISCLDERDQKAKRRIDHMVSVTAGMRPKQAAELLSQQEANLTVKILGALPPEKVSKIFNLMDKEVSARLQKQYMTMQK